MAHPTVKETNLEPHVREAERQIREILLDLEHRHGAQIDAVDVDTREFSELAVQIVASPST
jgi:hypothetical protein